MPSGPLQGVAIVDPVPLVRAGVAAVASGLGLDCCGEGDTIADALDHAHYSNPRLVVLGDLPLDAMLAAVARIAALETRPHVMVLLGPAQGAAVASVLAAGADGVARRSGSLDELLAAMLTVLDGGRHVAPTLAAELPGRLSGAVDVIDLRDPTTGGSDLSAREREMLVFLAQGRTNREIADALTISLATVKSHLVRVYAKLGVGSRAAALAAAVERGLLL